MVTRILETHTSMTFRFSDDDEYADWTLGQFEAWLASLVQRPRRVPTLYELALESLQYAYELRGEAIGPQGEQRNVRLPSVVDMHHELSRVKRSPNGMYEPALP